MNKIKKAGQDINAFMAKHDKAIKRTLQVATAIETYPLRSNPLVGAAALTGYGATQIKRGMNLRATRIEQGMAAKDAAMADQSAHLRQVAKTMRQKKGR